MTQREKFAFFKFKLKYFWKFVTVQAASAIDMITGKRDGAG